MDWMNELEKTTRMRVHRGNLPYLEFPAWECFPKLICGFTTREGGVSKGYFASFNLAADRGDDAEAVAENMRRWCAAMGIPRENLVRPYQTHTTRVECVDSGLLMRYREDASVLDGVDGLITNIPGIVLGLSFADCTPIYLYDESRQVCALSHAGWRGTVGGIAPKTVRRMQEVYGCRPEDLQAAIGPAISQENYQVSQEVMDAVEGCLDGDTEGVLIPDGPGHAKADIPEVNRRLLIRAGVRPERILMSGVCTYRFGERIFSHRYSEGKRGVNCAFLGIREDGRE